MNGASSQRSATRCFSCRRPGSFSRSASSGCPASTSGSSFSVVGLDVREQPDLLEQLVAQALRLVDDQRRDLTARRAVRERASSSAAAWPWSVRRRPEAERARRDLDELRRASARDCSGARADVAGTLRTRAPRAAASSCRCPASPISSVTPWRLDEAVPAGSPAPRGAAAS